VYEADYSPPYTAEVKNGGATPPFPKSLHGKGKGKKVKISLFQAVEAHRVARG
jgi:hypothetical protein